MINSNSRVMIEKRRTMPNDLTCISQVDPTEYTVVYYTPGGEVRVSLDVLLRSLLNWQAENRSIDRIEAKDYG